jgi:hypothetical protein
MSSISIVSFTSYTSVPFYTKGYIDLGPGFHYRGGPQNLERRNKTETQKSNIYEK